jgi:hypothetical protein
MFERASGKRFAVQHVPDKTLLAQFQAAEEPVQKSLAGLARFYAAGNAITMEQTARAFGVTLAPLAEYIARVTG